MNTYEFEDKLGHHVHPVRTGPYKREPVTCPACLDSIHQQRVALCKRYGWTEWPFKN